MTTVLVRNALEGDYVLPAGASAPVQVVAIDGYSSGSPCNSVALILSDGNFVVAFGHMRPCSHCGVPFPQGEMVIMSPIIRNGIAATSRVCRPCHDAAHRQFV